MQIRRDGFLGPLRQALDVTPNIRAFDLLEDAHVRHVHRAVADAQHDGRRRAQDRRSIYRARRPRLRGEPEPTRALGVEERLLAHAVASQQESAGAAVPDRQGEHPPQAVDAALAELLVEVGDDLGVRATREAVAAADELIPELAVVVDLAVADDDHRAVLVPERLVAPLDVDDSEAGHTERDTVFREYPSRVGTAVVERFAHPLDEPGLDGTVGGQRSRDSAHPSWPR